ncbi:hypothetical protein V500_02902 [Pseudogymnoascus sp. VKM F-4518 (FW-2643)]|nr:hypothetical protein V500_02902 [Pseudogymnoascus sp. VKM F-4518 (FW-2643)]
MVTKVNGHAHHEVVSDIHYWHYWHYWKHGQIGPFVVRKPLVLGHESAGIIVRAESSVKSLKLGYRVAIEPGVSCQSCDFCRAGKYNLCDDMQFAATCFVLPSHISIVEGALVEPLSIAVYCARLAAISVGHTVFVMGAGPIGLLCCAVAKEFGASVITVTDTVDSRLDFAKTSATTHTYKMEPQSPMDNAESILSMCCVSGGFDVVINATGVASCISCGITALRKGGVFIQAGLGAGEISFPVVQYNFVRGRAYTRRALGTG